MSNVEKVFTYDTETTGLPCWGLPSDDPSQPHIVQLAGVLCDHETGDTIQSLDIIIRPDGYEISEEVTAIHGITTEMAMDVGVPEKMAVEMLLAIRGDFDRVAYNKTFDQRIVRIALKRFIDDEGIVAKWAEKDDHHDPMRMVQKKYGGKVMKLGESLMKVTGRELEGAHSAMADAIACRDIYFALK